MAYSAATAVVGVCARVPTTFARPLAPPTACSGGRAQGLPPKLGSARLHKKSPPAPSVGMTSFSFRPAVAAVDSDQLSSSDSADKEQANKYYFVVANAKFMLDEEEHFKEVMFERLRNYGEQNKELDFWLVIEPKFLDKFPNITKRLKRPAVALVSTNGPWITYSQSASFEMELTRRPYQKVCLPGMCLPIVHGLAGS